MKIVQAQMAPILPHVPPELRELILWILQKDPKDRPKIKEILNDVSVIDAIICVIDTHMAMS